MDDYITGEIVGAGSMVYSQEFIRTGETRVTTDPPNVLTNVANAYTNTSSCDSWNSESMAGSASYYFIAQGRGRILF